MVNPLDFEDSFRDLHAVAIVSEDAMKQYAISAPIDEEILSLHKQLAAAKTPQEQTVLKRQIGATDRQIDQLVYELYGLTDEEIRIVEENT